LKKSFTLIALLLLLACNSKTEQKPVQTAEEKQAAKEAILKKWEEDSLKHQEHQKQALESEIKAYNNFLKELDSQGLKYESMSYEIFDSLYTNPKHWTREWRESYVFFEIDSSQTFQVGNLKFEAVYEENMVKDAEFPYGGVREMHISKKGKHLQTMKNLKDIRALGIVYVGFYDFNLDGYKDMRFLLSEGKGYFYEYYLFNSKTQQFEHAKEWDYIRPDFYNIPQKHFFTIPYGTCCDGDYELYQINGTKLKKLKKIYYNSLGEYDGRNTVVDVNQ